MRAGLESVDGTVYVKRVIGLPGDTVACCDKQGRVTVNGVGLNETYIDDNSYWAGSCPHPDNGLSTALLRADPREGRRCSGCWVTIARSPRTPADI